MRQFIALLLLLITSTPAFAVDTTIYGRLAVNSTTKGSNPCPDMTEAQRNAIASPSAGDCVYNTTSGALNVHNGSTWKSAGGGVNQWVTSASYQVDDVVIQSNKFYIALQAHTSGTFATDLAAAKWQLLNSAIKGKAQAGSSVNLEELQFPNELLTETASGKYLYEGGSTNLLVNPSMEHSTAHTSWTVSNAATSNESTVKVHGEKSVKLTVSGLTFAYYQDTTRHASQFADGVQCLASVRIKTSLSGISVCPRLAGATQSSGCATVNSDNKWMLYKVPFVCGGTSNGISIASSGAVTGDVYVDDAYLGTDAGIADVSVVTPWQSYTPTFTGFGTVTCSNCMEWRQVGSNIEIRNSVVIGTPTAVIAAMTLPNSYTARTNSASTQVVGRVTKDNSTGGAAKQLVILATNSSNTVNFSVDSYDTAIAPLTAQNGSTVVAAGQRLSFYSVSIPVNELSGSTQVFASSCGANCENVLSAYVADGASTTAVSKETPGGWINGNCTNPTTSNYVCSFDSGIFSTAPDCWAEADSSSNNLECKAHTSTSSQVQVKCSDAGSVDANFRLFCRKSEADYQSSRTIVGSFKEVVTAPGITKPKTCYYKFGGASATLAAPTECTTGTCVEVEDSCGTISAPARSAVGKFTDMTIASGTYANSSPLFCDCVGFDTTTGTPRECTPTFVTSDQAWSTTSSGGAVLNLDVFSNSGTDNDSYVSVKCEGQAP